MFPQGAIDRLLKDIPVDPGRDEHYERSDPWKGTCGFHNINDSTEGGHERISAVWQQEGPHIVPDPPPYCTVELWNLRNKLWTYRCWDSLKVGDQVLVPFGWSDQAQKGIVRDLNRRYRGPMPIKSVIRRLNYHEEVRYEQ